MRIAVIGAGIVGSLISRELSKYDLELHLIEKNPDVGWGTTKANSAIIHAGYDDPPGTMRARFCVLGNELYGELSRDLDFDFRRIGSHVVAFTEEEMEILEDLMDRGMKNGVQNLRILDREELLSMEPNLNPSVKASLWAPSAGITEPWEVAISAVENAMENGLNLHLNERVLEISVERGKVRRVKTNKGEYDVDIVINCAGVHADDIVKMAGAEPFDILPRKGEYILLDEDAHVVNSIIFPTPTKKSKGILILPTIDGGTLLGPTAEDLPKSKKDDLETTKDGIERIKRACLKLVPSLNFSRVLKTFAGMRAETKKMDFIIGKTKVWGFINVAGMRSPGLTAAPAIAKYVVEKIIQEDLGVGLERKKNFKPFRKRIPHIENYGLEEWEEVVKKDPRFGKMVCFCNKVSEGEIVEAIKRGARTLDGVKFRTKAGFGKCQGGFCTLRILEIMSRELGIPIEEIKLNNDEASMMNGKVRE